MRNRSWSRRAVLALLVVVGTAGAGMAVRSVFAEDRVLPMPPPMATCGVAPAGLAPPLATPCDQPLPINLPTALHLSQVRPLDIAIASERIRVASAELQRAQVLWLPTVYFGADYYRHDGQLQDVGGTIFGTSKSALLFGVGPSAVFAVTDAVFAPLAARQVVRARDADLQAASNDTLLAVAEAYFHVQQARGELAGAIDTVRRAEELVRRAEQLAPRLAPQAEADRTRAELARRRQAVQTARERWQVASAELARLLRLDAAALVSPLEPPHLLIHLVNPECPPEQLIALARASRPELAARQALVQATLQRVRQERWRPLIPSVWLRGASTNPAGTLAAGAFGGGINDRIGDFSMRSDFDIQLLWELQNLGLGNVARVNASKAEYHLSLLEQTRVQDRIAAEVVQALAQARSAALRLREAEQGTRSAVASATKNFEGLGQTRGAGNLLQLVIRPQEAVAAVQALAQAYGDYYAAAADYNRAQFRLYRALGNPAQELTERGMLCPPAPTHLPDPSPADAAESATDQPPKPPAAAPAIGGALPLPPGARLEPPAEPVGTGLPHPTPLPAGNDPVQVLPPLPARAPGRP